MPGDDGKSSEPASARSFPHDPHEWRSYRNLVGYSIWLRHQKEFQAEIRELREKWDIDPIGEDYDPEAVPQQIRWGSLWTVWNGVFQGVYPPGLETDDLTDKHRDYQRDVGQLLRDHVDLKRFPPVQTTNAAQLTDRQLSCFHPLGPFLSLCVRYWILSLPGKIGISIPPYDVRDESVDGDLVYIPADATRSEARQQIDELFDYREMKGRTSSNDPKPWSVGRRSLDDLLRAYEAWRLRKNGLRLQDIAERLSALDFDPEPVESSTISTRITKAEKLWNLPEATPPQEE